MCLNNDECITSIYIKSSKIRFKCQIEFIIVKSDHIFLWNHANSWEKVKEIESIFLSLCSNISQNIELWKKCRVIKFQQNLEIMKIPNNFISVIVSKCIMSLLHLCLRSKRDPSKLCIVSCCIGNTFETIYIYNSSILD
jgi:hypothetical protein